jgi:hypothetical protein
MFRRQCILLGLVLLAGCETAPVTGPQAPAGPRARLDETAKVHSTSKADFYVVTDINGLAVKNSMAETFSRNYGRGMVMTPYFVNQDLPAGQPVKIGVMARTYFAAPALAFVNDAYQVKGVVEFTPQENGRYIMRGELGEHYSAVWIEDRSNDAVVGTKVEIKGSAKLGFWEK